MCLCRTSSDNHSSRKGERSVTTCTELQNEEGVIHLLLCPFGGALFWCFSMTLSRPCFPCLFLSFFLSYFFSSSSSVRLFFATSRFYCVPPSLSSLSNIFPQHFFSVLYFAGRLPVFLMRVRTFPLSAATHVWL